MTEPSVRVIKGFALACLTKALAIGTASPSAYVRFCKEGRVECGEAAEVSGGRRFVSALDCTAAHS